MEGGVRVAHSGRECSRVETDDERDITGDERRTPFLCGRPIERVRWIVDCKMMLGNLLIAGGGLM